MADIHETQDAASDKARWLTQISKKGLCHAVHFALHALAVPDGMAAERCDSVQTPLFLAKLVQAKSPEQGHLLAVPPAGGTAR